MGTMLMVTALLTEHQYRLCPLHSRPTWKPINSQIIFVSSALQLFIIIIIINGGILSLTDFCHHHYGQNPSMVGFCHGRNALGNHDENDGDDSDVNGDVNGYCPFVGAPEPSLPCAQQTDLKANNSHT